MNRYVQGEVFKLKVVVGSFHPPTEVITARALLPHVGGNFANFSSAARAKLHSKGWKGARGEGVRHSRCGKKLYFSLSPRARRKLFAKSLRTGFARKREKIGCFATIKK